MYAETLTRSEKRDFGGSPGTRRDPAHPVPNPVPKGIPQTLTYGGKSFDITTPASSYSGSSNTAAWNAKFVVIRPCWTTHALNVGHHPLQSNNTYPVNKDGSIDYHVLR